MEEGAIAFLNWANLGSKTCTRKPPIRWGVLRGSSSAFVGNKLVIIFPGIITPGAPEGITPARSYGGKQSVITWGWNTEYARKMHAHTGGWGSVTRQDMDAGNQWLLMHLQKDKDDLMKVIAKEFHL